MPTVFQRLNKAFGGNTGVPTPTSTNYTRNVHSYAGLGSNDVIYTTRSKEDYTEKLAQLRQQRLLAKQWKRAQYETQNNALANMTEVQMMYREADMMDLFPEIGAALDIYMEEATYVKPNGMMINVTSKSERIKSILEDLIYNRLSADIMFPMITRSTVKYGNTFMLLNVTEDNGVIGWKQLPVYEMQRFENGMDNPYSSGFANVANIDVDSPDATKFVWVGKNEFTPYRNWQIAHFRLLYDSLYLPYGVSALNKARRHWRMLSMMEDMMLMYRLERSVERRVYKVNVGAIDEQDVPAYMDEVANNFKRTPIYDPLTGQLDLRRNIMSQMDDYFIPVRDPNEPNPIETLSAGNNLTAMDDIKFVQNKLCTALRVPKSFLNFEETTGDGKNLSLLDVRFTKTVNRVQQMMLMELTKVCIIHLYLLGFEDDLTNFSLTMNNPSSQAEMMELDNLSKKIEMAKSAVADPGGGLPLYSVTRAQKEILGWSDKQISDNLEELRLEKALAAELEQTAAIIKRTGLFDKVDNLYGEPGAEYGNNAGGQGQEDAMGGGGAPGGGMAGGLDMGDDMGDDMGGEMPGAEGDMSMDDAVASEDSGEDSGENEPLNEVFFNRLMQKTIKEKKDLRQNLMEKTKHYQNLLINKINESKIQEEKELNVPLYTKNFLINEELNSIAKGLGKHISEKK
ncbi:MAG: portal protein [Alphaproteobacteria bacterium]|nr:portal protein [Alphaproteobacteria bacterium]